MVWLCCVVSLRGWLVFPGSWGLSEAGWDLCWGPGGRGIREQWLELQPWAQTSVTLNVVQVSQRPGDLKRQFWGKKPMAEVRKPRNIGQPSKGHGLLGEENT